MLYIGLLWKIYKGFKKSTKQEASIFVFEKKQLDRWPKDDREVMLETLKRGVTQLTKIRHPQVLTVQHPLEESRESLAFATEPVFCSLANILGNTTNMPHPVPSGIASYKLYEVEIKYGLIQLAEGLSFLHSDVKLLHRNICPESILVNKQGAWKISGFDFCVLNQNPHEAKPFWPITEYNSTWHILTQPSLEYMAPEYALISSHSTASDIYSLGMLIYALHSVGGKPIKLFGKDFGAFKRFASELKQGKFPGISCVPNGLVDYVKLMLNATPEMRPDIHQLTKVPYFEDVGVKTLSYLDSLFQWDNLQKSKFYKGLPQIIQTLPHRINMYRILPCLVKEFVNPPMIPFVLPNVLLIAENCNSQEFTKHILPHLKVVFKIQDPIQILLIFMQKMELLLKLTPPEDVKTDVLPMLYRALESDAQQIHELCLSVIPTFASLIDYPAMKNALLPRIKKLSINTGFVSVRVNCLLCIGKLLEHLDKWLVLDEIIPFLPLIPSREPAVLMGILGIYKLALTHNKLGITKELIATKVIPFLVPLCIENGLSLNQFNALVTLVKDMFARVETEHRSKLEQLNSIQQESKALDMNYQSASGPLVASAPPLNNSDINDMFSGLGMDSFMGSPIKEIKSNVTSPIIAERSTNLTLEDKQRMANQQQQAQRLQQTPQIVKTGPLQISSQPKDLTSNMIESNLKQIKPSQNNWNSIPTTTGTSTNWNNNFGNFQSSQANTQWSTTNASNTSNNSNTNWNSQWSSSGPTGNTSNYNPLDSLLPNKNQQKVSMNQMSSTGGSQSLLLPENGNTQQTKLTNTNTLSSKDIMDFLN